MDERLTASFALCQTLARRAASNFYLAFWALPRAERQAMCALYAFFRHTDDLVDSSHEAGQRAAQLAAWRSDLEATIAALAMPAHLRVFPAAHGLWPALAHVIEQYHVSPDYLRDAITGAEMDLHPVQLATFADLERYCYHVAGTVGLACLCVWRCPVEQARQPALACGTAFQLTNILRDLAEDARIGRIYLPHEDLVRFGVSPADLAAERFTSACAALCRCEIKRAQEYFAQAAPLFDYVADPGRRVLRGMFDTYQGLLTEIERRGGNVFGRRARLPWRKKLRIAAALWWPRAPHRIAANARSEVAAHGQRAQG